MILAGIVVPPLIETVPWHCLGIALAPSLASTKVMSLLMLLREPAAVADASTDSSKEDPKAKFAVKARLVGAVLIGDFFHNLCDGFFIGASFRGCGDSFGWGVAAATVLHELPQEVADFVVLTGPDVGFSALKALAANFTGGLSVLLGAIIVLSANVDDAAVGLVLAFGGGVYLHIGAAHCLPKMYDPELTLQQRLLAFCSFVVGATLIGFILIGHEHCVPEGSTGHAGHNH